VYEWERDTLTRLTFGGEFTGSPVWTPDGQRITYSFLEKSGMSNLHWKRADGAGDAQRLTEGKNQKYPNSWRPDGKVLAFTQLSPDTSWDILTLAIEGDEKSGWKPGEPKPFLNSPFNEQDAAFSPMAAGSPTPRTNPETSKCTCGHSPAQAASGRFPPAVFLPQVVPQQQRTFYRTTDQKIMVATYTAAGDSFHADKSQLWSPGQFSARGPYSNFDVHPDSKRFAVLKAPAAGETSPVNKVSFISTFSTNSVAKFPQQKLGPARRKLGMKEVGSDP